MKRHYLLLFFAVVSFFAQAEDETKSKTPIEKHEKEQNILSSCVKDGGSPSISTERNGCRYVACVHPKSEKNCVHLVDRPKDANCSPGFCK